jgi:hypothetical protein
MNLSWKVTYKVPGWLGHWICFGHQLQESQTEAFLMEPKHHTGLELHIQKAKQYFNKRYKSQGNKRREKGQTSTIQVKPGLSTSG